MNTITTTRAVLVTGCDTRENEYTYWKIGGEWFDGYNEKNVTPGFIVNHVWQNITSVRFGSETMTRDEWVASGCPFSLSREEVGALRKLHTPTLSEQISNAYMEGMQADLSQVDPDGDDYRDLKRTQEDARL